MHKNTSDAATSEVSSKTALQFRNVPIGDEVEAARLQCRLGGLVIGGTEHHVGVTLGAGNFPKDACGMLIKGLKRHPTIGNNVTIYSGASVLGDITIGDNSVIGGNVWLTESMPAGTKITARPPENMFKFAKDLKL